ncbi:MAG: type III-A CRISPR-associated CARF protein Csm6, partial [Streptococcus vestibularis]
FDYQAAEAIINRKEYNKLLSKKRIAYIREKLNDFSRVFKNQSILSDILSFPLDDSQKKALNYYLLIDVLKEREHIADVLIKAKSLAEFVIEETIKKDHEGLIVFDGNLPKLNPDFPDCEAILDDIDKKMKKSRGIEDTEERIFSVQSTLNLLSYLNILEFYEYDSQLQTAINGILSLNGERNKVAHGLSEIDTRLLSRKKLKQLSENLRLLLVDCLGIDTSYFNYYDKQNEELIKMLE